MIATALILALLAVIFRCIARAIYDPWLDMFNESQSAPFVVFILLYWASALACGVVLVVAAWKMLP